MVQLLSSPTYYTKAFVSNLAAPPPFPPGLAWKKLHFVMSLERENPP